MLLFNEHAILVYETKTQIGSKSVTIIGYFKTLVNICHAHHSSIRKLRIFEKNVML